jgi:hypothetical protein
LRVPFSQLIVIASLVLSAHGAALAQDPAPSASPTAATATDERLDRIEGKLDEILRRLGAQRAPTLRPAGAPALATAATAAANNANLAIDTSAYKAGALAIFHRAPDYARDLQQIPADSVGGFVYSGGVVALNDLRNKGVRFTGLAGVELQGWLKVATPGRTQIAVEYRANGVNAVGTSNCIANAWLENRSIGTQTGDLNLPATIEKTLDLNLGADVQPGLYRLHLWAVCTPVRDLKLTAEILIKSPADMNLRPLAADELLHQGG